MINLWSSPRNISTALMYSFAQRKDCIIFDEPLYAHYLRVSNIQHPGRELILQSQNQKAHEVILEILEAEKNQQKWALCKQMTHHLVDLDWNFLLDSKNVMLIRNPREIIASYSKVIPYPTMQDIGIKKQMDVYHYLKNNNKKIIIIDTNQLLKNPSKMLETLCNELEIPFDENMLKWKAGSIKEDGIWAKYWYHNVHQSTGFAPYKAKSIQLNALNKKLAEEAMPFYNELFELSLLNAL